MLTDYNNLAAFVPGMRTSRIVSAPGEPLLVRSTGQSGFLFFSVPVEIVTRMEELPIEAIRFYAVGGNLKSKSGEWAEHPVGKGEFFHVEVKPVDPNSKTRISYAEVKFSAINRDNKKKVSGTLHPM